MRLVLSVGCACIGIRAIRTLLITARSRALAVSARSRALAVFALAPRCNNIDAHLREAQIMQAAPKQKRKRKSTKAVEWVTYTVRKVLLFYSAVTPEKCERYGG